MKIDEPAQHPQVDVQNVQSAYRRQIVESWAIAPGSRVLELGCGQGDLTAVLAEVVGPRGHIVAIDCAGPDYGSPMTLGEATRSLQDSPVGGRIEFRLNCNILDPGARFERDAFDLVVMAHSSWYFASLGQLELTLGKAASLAKRFCYCEWDMALTTHEQLAHWLAVSIQGQVEAFKSESEANVRTPFPREVLLELLARAGWTVVRESDLSTTGLQDADWEIAACVASTLDQARALNLPDRVLSILESQLATLRRFALPKGNPPLPSYSLTAESSG